MRTKAEMEFDSYKKLAHLVWFGLPSPGTPTQRHLLVEFFRELYEKIEFLESQLLQQDEEI
jgi:hypothetical protein